MDTRSEIIRIGDTLIREKGYNAFSFSDISKQLKIKNASIHYHFPTKTSLGVSIVRAHIQQLEILKQKNSKKEPLDKLNSFLSIYSTAKSENKICLVGSLSTDLYTVEEEVQLELKKLVNNILQWVIEILDEGKSKKKFKFQISTRIKAIMIITNMLASLQLTRLTNEKDFQQIKQTIIKDLTE
ncbi:MAG TPA: TetR/AcrR family transcriptional regulator [Chitinophagaceae bacterium]|jgi:AcrR family transcriptional regulator|nr:TetR/AcrR family transcriptional regulator [Chitinophagaceae bacterium]